VFVQLSLPLFRHLLLALTSLLFCPTQTEFCTDVSRLSFTALFFLSLPTEPDLSPLPLRTDAPEVFATPSRGTGDAFAATASRLAGILAPIIKNCELASSLSSHFSRVKTDSPSFSFCFCSFRGTLRKQIPCSHLGCPLLLLRASDDGSAYRDCRRSSSVAGLLWRVPLFVASLFSPFFMAWFSSTNRFWIFSLYVA